jgi:2-polyprenyl-3-methyl-5-hydroxy-6-metoxy-1,4-benzoquinol methylase
MKKTNQFDKDYYENGVKKGISGYENYKWIPTRSIPEAITICEKIHFHSAIDFGCAKGFLVHALNLLGKNVVGVDISEYALETSLPQVKDKLYLLNKSMSEIGLEKFKNSCSNLSKIPLSKTENISSIFE